MLQQACNFDDNLVSFKEYKVLGKLPDPFLMKDGTRADTPEKWREQRKELYKTAVELQYGTLPPQPEFVDVDVLYKAKKQASYRIITGTYKNPVSFHMKVIKPDDREKFPSDFPVVIDGDLSFMYAFDKEYINTFTQNGIMVVLFDRTELAHDIQNEGRQGQLYHTYKDHTFGALAAWAWGYSRCIDALEKIADPDADLNCIAFTGHSRGGKTVALAGAVDERAAIVNPNDSCAGACSCYRIHIDGIQEGGGTHRSETLKDVVDRFPYWFGPDLGQYKDREEELPFDCHFLKALVAPRILFVSEAASDMWSSPVGSWQTSEAAREVYKMLGAEENLYWYFRKGFHFHKIEDLEMLVNVIRHKKYGEPINDYFFKTPFKKPELIFDWRSPV